MKKSIFNLVDLENFRKDNKLDPYRVRQILLEIWKNFVLNFEEMTTLPKDVRNIFDENFTIISLKLKKMVEDDETVKFIFETADGNIVESVLMYHFSTRHENKLNRMTVCISTQSGCPVWCTFCVTGKLWLKQNLSAQDIVSQFLFINNYIKNKFGKKPDGTWYSTRNLVYMWMGEPFLNYDNFKESAIRLTKQEYGSLGFRHITVSTVWIIDGITKFISDGLPVSLAFSLHSPNQVLREKLIPFAKFYKLDDIFRLLKKYTSQTGNQIFVEYVMIKDINDSEPSAHETGVLLSGIKSHLNLIPYNTNQTIWYDEPELAKIRKFQNIVESYNVTVTIRWNMGRKNKGACGQLGRDEMKPE